MKISTFRERSIKYIEHARNLEKSRFKTGLTELDEAIGGVACGEQMTIIAYSGTYKSALLQNLLVEAGIRTNLYQLFFTMEMPETKLFEREMQMYHNKYRVDVERSFKSLLDIDDLVAKAEEGGADRLLTIEEPNLTLKDISNFIDKARLEFGEIGAVGIDYMGLIQAKGSEYERISEVAQGCKNLAKEKNIPVIVLAQVSRAALGEGVGTEIQKHHGKGSGAVESAADFQIGMYRDDKNDIVMKLLKNRNGYENLKWKMLIKPEFLKIYGLEVYVEPEQTTFFKKK